ncbi:MAG: PAS domain-containing protein [Magnetococcales bacterium]|nr:PAS domain-containing protein [Magnetococcales bacterium]
MTAISDPFDFDNDLPAPSSSSNPSSDLPLDFLLDHMTTGIVAVDGTGCICRINSAAERLLGKPRRHLMGRSLNHILPGHPVALDLIERAGKLLMPCRARNASLSPGPGQRLSVSLTAVPLLDDDSGSPVGTLLQLEEVGAAERLEEGQRLHDTMDSMGSLALAVAHEVKNPLTGIRGAAQLLEMEANSETGTACTDLIRTEVDRVSRLLDNLLGLAEEHATSEDEINIHEILDHVIRITSQGCPSPSRDYDPSLPPIRGDRDRLIQLFLNLVKNAQEASEGEAHVSLHTRISNRVRFEQGRRSRHVVAEVRDDGPGIPPELRKRVFLPFVTTKSRGTGLGLAIAQKIVHDHGGLLEVESRSGRTAFRIFFPLVPPGG